MCAKRFKFTSFLIIYLKSLVLELHNYLAKYIPVFFLNGSVETLYSGFTVLPFFRVLFHIIPITTQQHSSSLSSQIPAIPNILLRDSEYYLWWYQVR